MRIRLRRAAAVLWPLMAVGGAVGVWAQTAATQEPGQGTAYVPTLTFDVASVRESLPPAEGYFKVGGGFTPHSSSLRLTNFDARNLLHMAYGYDGFYEISGVPASLQRTMFNVEARSDAAADEKLSKLGKKEEALEQQHMMQALLAERFHLKAHWETREGNVFNLTAKNGSKMQATKGSPPSAAETKTFGDHPVPPLYQRGSSLTGFDFVANGASMEMIVSMLSGQFGRPLVDKTGLTGRYDFTLRYYGTWVKDRSESETNPLPPLENAVEEQLGLKVERGKGPVKVLVVDHMEQPSEN